MHNILDPDVDSPQVAPGLCALGIMTKAPHPGHVKTRLTPPLTPEEAAELNICFLRDTTTALALTARRGGAQGIGVYTPRGEEAAYASILPPEFAIMPQRGDGFGERLTFATEDLLRVGFASLCLIDSDSPTVPESAYARAVELLARPGDRIVLGPSDDGGYYLIGLKQTHHRVFEEIDWSTEQVAAQTIERVQEIGVELEILPTWYDVDDRATLRRLCNELLNERARDTPGSEAPATRRFLESVVAREGRERIWPSIMDFK